MKSKDNLLSKAQDLVYQAWEATTTSGRKALATKAITISPFCADAFNILAELETDPEAAFLLYQNALNAAQAVLGPETFEDDKGHFWGLLETRPYMRARAGMARSLWAAGDLKSTAQHYQAMLELNPNDNQGIRHELVAVYLELGDLGELRKLLSLYEDEITAIWQYTKALVAFKDHGDSVESQELLAVSIEENKYVPAYLIGKKNYPKKCLHLWGWAMRVKPNIMRYYMENTGLKRLRLSRG